MLTSSHRLCSLVRSYDTCVHRFVLFQLFPTCVIGVIGDPCCNSTRLSPLSSDEKATVIFCSPPPSVAIRFKRALCNGISGYSAYPLTNFVSSRPFQCGLGVPRVWRTAVYCSSCHYPNDLGFHFCQQCGVSQRNSTLTSERVPLDMNEITSRLHFLRKTHRNKPYQLNKPNQLELETFLASLPQLKHLTTASRTDLVHFLI